jgi:hypothetical protein
MKLYGFNTPPGVYQTEKTTIKQGIIVREWVWKDTLGNELEKISDKPPKFIVKKAYNSEATAESRLRDYFAERGFEIQFRKSESPPNSNINNSMEDEMVHVIIIASLILLFLSSFYLGLCVATWKKSHKTSEIGIQNDPQLERFQTSA